MVFIVDALLRLFIALDASPPPPMPGVDDPPAVAEAAVVPPPTAPPAPAVLPAATAPPPAAAATPPVAAAAPTRATVPTIPLATPHIFPSASPAAPRVIRNRTPVMESKSPAAPNNQRTRNTPDMMPPIPTVPAEIPIPALNIPPAMMGMIDTSTAPLIHKERSHFISGMTLATATLGPSAARENKVAWATPNANNMAARARSEPIPRAI